MHGVAFRGLPFFYQNFKKIVKMKKIIVFLIAFTVFFGACKQEKTKTKYYVYFLHDNMTEYCESFGDTLKVEKAITEWRTKSKLNTVQILKSYQ